MKPLQIVYLFLLCALAACSKDAPIEVTPFEPTLNRKSHTDWYQAARPNMQELGWTMWNWSPQLAPAARMASASNKPLLLWLEHGHPLSITSEAGRQRRALWMDSNLNASLARFQFAADDLEVLFLSQNPDDPEAALAVTLLQKAMENGTAIHESGGVLMASAGGKLLGSYSGQDSSALQEELSIALANWDALPREQRRLKDLSAMVSAGRSADLFPDDGMALEVHRRSLDASMDIHAPRSLAYTHDYLWFSASELAPLVPTRMGEVLVVPTAQAQRLAQFLLVDDAHGEGRSFSIDDLQQTDLSFTAISKVGNTIRFTASGVFMAEDANQRGMRCVIEGMGSVNLAQHMIVSLNLAVQAQSWGPEIERLEDGSWPLLMMGVHRADSFEGSHRITPSQFGQYPAGWPVTE